MPIDPEDNVDYQVQGIPYDKNRKGLSVVTGAIVNGTGEIIGYLPLKVTNNGDGTASLDVTSTIIFDPDIDIGDVHLLNIAGNKIDPATEQKQDDTITQLTSVNAVLGDIVLIDYATETTLAAFLTAFNAEDFATETTLAAIKAQADKLTFTGSDLNVTSTDPVGLKDTGGTPIDPATEQKQDDIITEIQNITSGAVDVSVTTTRRDSPENDAFGRLRVSNPVTLLDSQLQYDTAPLIWDTVLSGGGAVSHLPDESAASLSVGTASGDLAQRRTHKYVRYSPGKSQQIFVTGAFNAAKANLTQRIGYFDDNDGLFFQLTDAGISVVRRTSTSGSPVDNVVLQSSWSLDPMNGAGPSGITLDPTKAQIFTIDFEWLSVGRVRFGVVVNGSIIYVHETSAANVSTDAYMATANLPLCYEIRNTGVTSGPSNLKQICATVLSEGGPERFRAAIQRAADNGLAGVSVSTLRPVITLRPKLLYKGKTNRAQIIPVAFNLAANKDIQWKVILNGTLTGASFNSVDPDSLAEVDIAATAITGGRIVDVGTLATGGGSGDTTLSAAGLIEFLALTLNSAGTAADTFTITSEVSGPAGDVKAALKWAEIFQ